MNFGDRLVRHARITWKNYASLPSPPFLILYINSICNQKCEHCLYWKNLNRRDDLSREEMFELSRSLGRIENLNLSGGEPFLRNEFGEIARQFIGQNQVRQIYVPTNGSFPDRTVKHIADTLKAKDLDLFVTEISLDGLGEFHDRFRGWPGAFEKAMQTYEALVKLQETDARLRIHAISTATGVNMDELRRLSSYLFEHCPKMDHHSLGLIRGDRKNPSLQGPSLEQYRRLYEYIRRLWAPREESRYGSFGEPMLQWVKLRTAREQQQVVSCRAGRLSAVVFSNGDVSVCETHAPIGNLRQKSFWEIWSSPEAQALRKSISSKECYCTNEISMWSSINYQPVQMVRTILGAKPWKAMPPLEADDQEQYGAGFATDHERLVSITTRSEKA